MSIVKKWAGCVVSFLAGVLALALSACSGMVATYSAPVVGENSTITKAFKVITDSKLLDDAKLYGAESKFMVMKVFSIIMLVIAVLLLVYSIVMLLKNVNVIKAESKIFAIVGLVLAALFLVSTIGVLVSSYVYAAAVESAIPGLVSAQSMGMILATMVEASVKIGVYQPIMLVVGVVTAATVAAFEIKNVK